MDATEMTHNNIPYVYLSIPSRTSQPSLASITILEGFPLAFPLRPTNRVYTSIMAFEDSRLFPSPLLCPTPDPNGEII